ncbi:peptide ABC transporter substrate-binding protein [Lactobacillus sp. DCY120]|uniref:Peptide ABC transporter substrate-binding protein n=2 Tax=Bombilactobacillus apium TaxID=2675299 RepID=A0A850R6X0_9LACO|nr:peptide ABC transporter substrate-binding protein [Bombilactobacillus apium]
MNYSIKDNLFTIITVLLLPLTLSACGKQSTSSQSKAKIQTTAKLSANYPITTLDISTARGFDQASNLNDSLLYLNSKKEPVPALAEKVTVANSGKTYTFRIRRGAQFSNGDPITAQSFVYSWRRTLNPQTKSLHTYLFEGITNAQAVSSGKMDPSALGVKALDDHTLQVRLDYPIAYFKKLLTYSVFAPQDRKIVEKYGKSYGQSKQTTVFSGPYVIEKWSPEAHNWIFKKNPRYWDRQVVRTKRIEMYLASDPQTSLMMYQSKKLDFTIIKGDQVTQYAQSKELYRGPYSYMNYLEYNQKVADPQLRRVFQNRNLRRAISLTINRRQIAQKILDGSALVPSGLVTRYLANNPRTQKDFADDQAGSQSVAHDITLARKLWRRGLQEVGTQKVAFTLTLSDDSNNKKVAEYLKYVTEKNLSGLKITLQPVPSNLAYQRSVTHNYEAELAGRGADIADPIAFLQPLMTNNPLNRNQWSNRKYDQLVREASYTNNQDQNIRWQKMLAAEKILLDQQIVTPLYQNYNSYLKRPYVHGITHNTTGPQWNYKYLYLKK